MYIGKLAAVICAVSLYLSSVHKSELLVVLVFVYF